MNLRRQEVPVAIEPQPEIEREALRRAPGVGGISAVRPQPVDRLRRVAQKVNLDRGALPQDVDDVAIGAGRIALGGQVAEDLPSELEVVVAQAAVMEIADRPEHLVAADVELADTRGPGHEIVAQILVARGRRVVCEPP